jgi:hypothetical protein
MVATIGALLCVLVASLILAVQLADVLPESPGSYPQDRV